MRGLSCVLLVLLAACGGAQAGAGAAAGPETMSFAPQLQVDLSAMERLPTGVYVRDLRVGEGAQVRRGDRVSAYFVGWLPDGTQFDATARPSAPVEFELGDREVIRGWEDGLVGMRVGGQRQLIVPPSRGYGRTTVGRVPPNSTLVFVIEVLSTR